MDDFTLVIYKIINSFSVFAEKHNLGLISSQSLFFEVIHNNVVVFYSLDELGTLLLFVDNNSDWVTELKIFELIVELQLKLRLSRLYGQY